MDFETVIKMLFEAAGMVFIPVAAVAALAAIRVIWKRGSQMHADSGELRSDLDALRSRLDAIEQRGLTSGEVDAQYSRLAELEERVDFAERLLAQQPGGVALPPPGIRHASPPNGSPVS